MGFKPHWAGGPEDSVSPSQLCCCLPQQAPGCGVDQPLHPLVPHEVPEQ